MGTFRQLLHLSLEPETTQTALTAADICYWFIARFGELDSLQNTRFSPVIMDGLSSLIIQLFFCYRFWILNKWLAGVLRGHRRGTSRPAMAHCSPTKGLYYSSDRVILGWTNHITI